MNLHLPFSALNYSSYKDFLQDAYEQWHSQDESFSYELLAQNCELKTRTQAKNIIKGIHAPTTDQLLRLATYFGLDDKEKKYLLCLFKFQDTKSGPQAFELFEQLMQMQKSEASKINPFKDVEVMTSVLHMTLLSVFEFNNKINAQEIVELLKNKFSYEQVLSAIQDLVDIKYIELSETGEWIMLQKHIRKYDYNSNFFLKKFHNECLDLSRQALNEDETSERYLIGASFAINHRVFPRIIQKVNAFIENLMQLDNVGGTPDTVVQLNTQFIKMTKVTDTEKKRVLGSIGAERVLS